MKEKLAEIQKKIDAIYEKEGLTDRVLDLQIELNSLRHVNDIPDENNIEDTGYVQ